MLKEKMGELQNRFKEKLGKDRNRHFQAWEKLYQKWRTTQFNKQAKK